jgi:hypothetical protein
MPTKKYENAVFETANIEDTVRGEPIDFTQDRPVEP